MNNLQVIENFLRKQDGKTPLRNVYGWYDKGRTLYTETNEKNCNQFDLINYETLIAYWNSNQLFINNRKYSTTTSKIQTQLKNMASRMNINYTLYMGE